MGKDQKGTTVRPHVRKPARGPAGEVAARHFVTWVSPQGETGRKLGGKLALQRREGDMSKFQEDAARNQGRRSHLAAPRVRGGGRER